MKDNNWELISGEDAHEIEILNYANQVNVIEALFRSMIYHHGGGNAGCPKPLAANILRELHRTSTLFLLGKPGEYRVDDVHIVRTDGTVAYEPPRFFAVPDLVKEFESDLAQRWLNDPPLTIAAFALWKINWIHPFKNGNGRTARAFSYACLCLRYGMILPGSTTMIDLIMDNRPEYNAHLAWADKTLAENGSADLSPMISLLDRLLIEQLTSVEGRTS